MNDPVLNAIGKAQQRVRIALLLAIITVVVMLVAVIIRLAVAL